MFVVLTVVVMVLVSVTTGPGGSGRGNGKAPAVVPARPSVLHAVGAVTAAEASAVGLPSSVFPPLYDKSQKPLTGSGARPQVLYIGGEFCPVCAADRWALVMALSRFGTFSGLHETTSSPWDDYPSTATFTFYRSRYASRAVDLVAVENMGNDTTGPGTSKRLVPLTAAQSAIWSTYTSRYGRSEGYPFLDIGNRVVFLGGSFDPRVLAGLDQVQIAARLANPDDPVTQAIVGSANYVTAGICAVTGASASAWCSAGGVVAAARKLGLPS